MVLTKALLVKLLTEKLPRFEKHDVSRFVEAFFEQIKSSLERGEPVKLAGLGNFLVREKKARPGRNPKTGEEIMIKPRKVILFHPSPKLKEQVQEKAE